MTGHISRDESVNHGKTINYAWITQAFFVCLFCIIRMPEVSQPVQCLHDCTRNISVFSLFPGITGYCVIFVLSFSPGDLKKCSLPPALHQEQVERRGQKVYVLEKERLIDFIWSVLKWKEGNVTAFQPTDGRIGRDNKAINPLIGKKGREKQHRKKQGR